MKLERGINLGGYLSQCVHSTEHYDAFIQEEDIRKIASMGFDHVRLAIDYEVLDYCSIRKCVNEKGYNTCGDCKELDDCQIVGAIFQHAPDAKENLL